MIIYLKNKDTLQIDDFYFKCSIGKNGISKHKIEGDKKTPSGKFGLGHLYLRSSRIKKPTTKLKSVDIKKKMGWCDDIKSKKYNKLCGTYENIKHEKLYRKDTKYDLLIPIKYNFSKPKPGKGSCIFIHLTKDYSPTAGCIAINKKDFLILLKLISRNTKILI